MYDPVLDVNGDGVLSADERRALFAAMDRDGDGHVDAEGFRFVYAL